MGILYTKCMICMFRLVHEYYRAWRLYTKSTICMLQVWVHCDCIICTIACYRIGTIFLLVIVNMEYDIIVFIVPNLVFQIWIISAKFGSSRFCWVNFSLFLCMSVVHGEFVWRICSSLTVCSQFLYESSTWIRNLKLVLGTWIFNYELGQEPTYMGFVDCSRCI